ncbi:aldehyde dehydrogenase [Clostridium sp. MSJ-4]|uniref:Aldehyde dehydrogenase n=1 Tax=Clostridium simiarum TaxID=2841506 RepID=A0ABS6F0J3_9CLOT|nr:aldehyde dehydrogenase [Clostridium simiarum]MBU5592003.1 aldehyde dehydrogenase [Clostridium simiarum]
MNEAKELINTQRSYFLNGNTLPIDFRIKTLKKLKISIINHEDEILDALWKDLRKSKFEAYATEIGLVLEEIDLAIKSVKKWSKAKRKRTPMVHFPASSYVYPQPYGVVLIMSPWNYPFQLTMAPLVGALTAGNCAVIKPSKYSPNINIVLKKIIKECFQREYVDVIYESGGREAIREILEQKFDYIFFTGSVSTGKVVMESASKHLTPITLELGGKSPCIVDKDADIDLSAKRIVWGKLVNAGQTCVAPDYLMIHKSIKANFIESMKKYIEIFYGKDSKLSPDYPRIINSKQFDRLKGYLEKGNIVVGGNTAREELYFEPTVIEGVSLEDPIMKEEIFGPIFPLLEFEDLSEVIHFVNSRPKPLALYYFSENKTSQETILKNTASGGSCINDTIIHVASHHIPFGGVGESGMGGYHGKSSFETFSHYKSVIKRGRLDINFRYAPYKERFNLLKKIM